MIQDLHSHTYYSFCGADTPEQVVETAIAGEVPFTESITVRVIAIPKTPPSKYHLLTSEKPLKLRFPAKSKTISESRKAVP